MKKNHIIYIMNIAIVLMVIVILSVLLYPTVSNYINSLTQSRVVARYTDEVAGMGIENKELLLDAAHKYNENLISNTARFLFTKEDTEEYKKLLNTGLGVMGILVIDKIDVNLPVYHSSEEGVLQVGLGHMQGTSLPVGGEGTHAFITGHRGLPSSILLTNLDKMVEGDTFVLYVLGDTLTYQVDQIKTVEPSELKSLEIDPDKDYCTLVTCTPYGVNSHRLLVRGHRVENAKVVELVKINADAEQIDKFRVVLLFIVPVLPVLTVVIIIRCRKIRKEGSGF